MLPRILAGILVMLLGMSGSARVAAETPVARLLTVFPAGGQAGSTLLVTITGADLDEASKLHCAHPGITAQPKLTPAGAAEPGKFLLTIAKDVPNGLFDLRAVGRFGVTNPRTFVVSAAQELVGYPGNTSTEKAVDLPLGAAIHAVAEPNADHYFRIALKAGQRATVCALSTQLDSKMEPVLVAIDSAGRELSHNRWGLPLELTARADGTCLIRVHDLLYRGGPEYFYRLDARVTGDTDSTPRGTLRWPFPPAAAFVESDRLMIPRASTGAPSAACTEIHPPCDVVAQFSSARIGDVYSFNAQAGAVFWIEVLSHRLGQLASAPLLLIQRVTKADMGHETATDIQEVYDSPNTGTAEFSAATRDPVTRLEVKEAGTYRVVVRNLFAGAPGQPAVAYRLSVRAESPDFRLVTVPASPLPEPKDSKDVPLWSTLLRKCGSVPIHVIANRRDGFTGEIRLGVDGLPPGVSASVAIIPPGATTASILLTASTEAPGWFGPIHVHGTARLGDVEVTREAMPGVVSTNVYDAANKLVTVRSRIADEFMLAVSDTERASLTLALAGVPSAATSKPATLPTTKPSFEVTLGGKLSIPVQLARTMDFTAPIAFKLAGHTLLAASPEVTADPKADSVKLELDPVQLKLPPGTYSIYVQAQGKLRYVNGIDAAKASQAQAASAAKRASELTAAVKVAEKSLAHASAGTDADAKRTAAAALSEAKLKQAAAEAEKTTAQARATDLNAKSQPRDVTASFYSPAFIVNVLTKPAAAPATK